MEEENVRKVYNNIFEKYIVNREYITVDELDGIIKKEKILDSRCLKVCDVLKKFIELRNEVLNKSKNIDIFNVEIEKYRLSYINVEAPNNFTGNSDNNLTRDVDDFVKIDAFDEVPFDYNITYTDSEKTHHNNYSLQPITSIHGCEFAVMCEKILLFIKKSLETYRTEIENTYGFDYEESKIVEYKGVFSFFDSSYSVKECIDTCSALNSYTDRSIEDLNTYYKSCFDGVSVIFDSILKLEKHVKNDITEEETKKLESNELFLKTIGILENQLKVQFEDKLKEKDKLIEESQRKLKEKESEIEILKNQIEQQKKENEELKDQLEQKAKELSLLIEQLNESKKQLDISENYNSFKKPQESKQFNIESTNLLDIMPNELKSKIEQVENFGIAPEVQNGGVKQQNMLEISDLLIFNQQTIGEDMADSDKTNYDEVAQKMVMVVNYFSSSSGENGKKYSTLEEILQLNDNDFSKLKKEMNERGNNLNLPTTVTQSMLTSFYNKFDDLKKKYDCNENKSIKDILFEIKDSSNKSYFNILNNNTYGFKNFYNGLLKLPDFADSVKKNEEEDDTKPKEPVIVTNTLIDDDSDNSSSPKKVKLGVNNEKDDDEEENDNDDDEDDDEEEEEEEELTNINTQANRDAPVGTQDPLIEISKKRVKNLSSLYYLVGTFGNELTDNGDESKIGFPVAFLLNSRNEDNPDREGSVPMLSKLSDDFVEIINKKNNDSDSKEIILNIIRSNIPNFSDNKSDLQRIIGEYLSRKSDNQDINKVYEEDLKNNLYGFLDKIFIEQAAAIHHNNKKSEESENDRQAFLKNYESNIDKGRKFLQRVTVANSKIQESGNVVEELFNNVSSLIKIESNNKIPDSDAFNESCKKLNNIYDVVAVGPDENKTIVKDLEVKDAKELEFSKDEQERRNQNENILEAMDHAERVRKQFKKENDNPNGKIVEIIDNDKATVITKKDNNGKETALKYPADFSDEYIEVVKKTGNSIEVDLDQKTVNIDELDRNTWNLKKIKAIYGEQTTSVEIVTINEVNFIIPSNACDWLEINKLIGKYRGVLAGMLEYMQKISLLRIGKELNKNLSCIISVGNGKSLDGSTTPETIKILTKPGLTATDGKYKGRFLKRDDELLKKSLGGVYDSVKTSLFVGATNELSNSVQNTWTQNIS